MPNEVPTADTAKRAGGLTPLGWTVAPPLVIIEPVDGVRLSVRQGDAADCLRWIAWRVHTRLYPLQQRQCWGYALRTNRNDPAVWSEHAGGAAIDLNALDWPNGYIPTAGEVQRAHAALPAVAWQYVRWGGDYHGRRDSMHWELRGPSAAAALAHLLRTT